MAGQYSLLPPRGPAWPELNMPEVRMVAHPHDQPFAPPPYSSLFRDVLAQLALAKRSDALRQEALHSLRLKAGMSPPPNGGLGLYAVPRQVPEQRSGAFYSLHI